MLVCVASGTCIVPRHLGIRLIVTSSYAAVGDEAEQADRLTAEPSDAQFARDSAVDSTQQQPVSAAVTIASINFIDLAGSERASQTNETGDNEKLRQKEVWT